MGLVTDILNLAKQPPVAPKLFITKEQRSDIILGETVTVKDPHYCATWNVWIHDRKIGITDIRTSDLQIDCTEDLRLNPVRQKELEEFYKKPWWRP